MSLNEPAFKRQKRARDELDSARPPVFGANQDFPFAFRMATRAWGMVFRPRERAQREVPRIQHTTNHHHMHLPPASWPQVLLGFLKLFFYLCLAVIFICLVLLSIHTFWRDVDQRVSRYRLDVVQDITMCAMHYKTNLCATNPIPAMAHQCASWETCVNQDPTIVSRVKVAAEMLAETLNSFVEPIGLKPLAFISTFLIILIVRLSS